MGLNRSLQSTSTVLFCVFPSLGVIFIFLGVFAFWLIYFLSTLSTINSLYLSISLLHSIINLDYIILPSLFNSAEQHQSISSASHQHSLIHFQTSFKNSDLAFSLYTHSIFTCRHSHSIFLIILQLPLKPPTYLKPLFSFWLQQPLFLTYLTFQHIST